MHVFLMVLVVALLAGCTGDTTGIGTSEGGQGVESDYLGRLLDEENRLHLLLVVDDVDSSLGLELIDRSGREVLVGNLQFQGRAHFAGHEDSPLTNLVLALELLETQPNSYRAVAREDDLQLTTQLTMQNQWSTARLVIDLHRDATPPQPPIDVRMGTMFLPQVR